MPLASADEVRDATDPCRPAAQTGWAATQPPAPGPGDDEISARLINGEQWIALRNASAASTARPCLMPAATCSAGLEVVEVCIGRAQMGSMGEFNGQPADRGIDLYAMRQGGWASWRASTPFNFGPHDPRCGRWRRRWCRATPLVLKPSERTPSTPSRLPNCGQEAALARRVLQVVNGDRGGGRRASG